MGEHRKLTSRLRNASLALLFPSECVLCAKPVNNHGNMPCCQNCWDEVEVFSGSRCQKCDLLFGGRREDSTISACENCAGLRFSFARAVGSYEGAIKASVLRLKSIPSVSDKLAVLLHRTMERLPCLPDVITAPPLHITRLRERGYNQAELLAKKLSKAAEIPASFSIAEKLTNTGRHRAAQDRRDRMNSLKDAFVVRAPRGIEGRRVLIVDDLVTTGATADALSSALLDAGAGSVMVLSIARASGYFVN